MFNCMFNNIHLLLFKAHLFITYSIYVLIKFKFTAEDKNMNEKKYFSILYGS